MGVEKTGEGAPGGRMGGKLDGIEDAKHCQKLEWAGVGAGRPLREEEWARLAGYPKMKTPK